MISTINANVASTLFFWKLPKKGLPSRFSPKNGTGENRLGNGVQWALMVGQPGLGPFFGRVS